jgi:hypothetical protein
LEEWVLGCVDMTFLLGAEFAVEGVSFVFVVLPFPAETQVQVVIVWQGSCIRHRVCSLTPHVAQLQDTAEEGMRWAILRWRNAVIAMRIDEV